MTAQQNSDTARPLSLSRITLLGALLALVGWLLPVASAQAAAPAWGLEVTPIGGSYFPPGANGNPSEGPGYVITATNTGSAATTGTYTIKDTLPPRISAGAGITGEDENGNALTCLTSVVEGSSVVTCTGTVPVGVGEKVEVTLPVNVEEDDPEETDDTTEATNSPVVEGGGAPSSASASVLTFLTNGRPAWAAILNSGPTHLNVTTSEYKTNLYYLEFANVGGAPTSGTITVTFTTSAGMKPTAGYLYAGGGGASCAPPVGQEVTCTSTGTVRPAELAVGEFELDMGTLPEGSPVSAQVEISGGNARDAYAASNTVLEEANAPFDFLPGANGLATYATGTDGQPATQAGSHPATLAVQIGFPNAKAGPINNGSGSYTSTEGGLRDAASYLPPGLVINPQALTEKCVEAQMEQDSCPEGSAVGVSDLETSLFSLLSSQSPLFAVQPPFGAATSFSFDAVGVGIYPHINGQVQNGGDYALGAVSHDVLELYADPFLALRFQFWGDPSDPIYNRVRADCDFSFGGFARCPVEERQTTPLFSMPTSCTATLPIEAFADSWGLPGVFDHRQSLVTDTVGNPTGTTGCNALEFEPSLLARPTTNVADSPSGLDFDLGVTQNVDFKSLAAAHLKKTVISLPEGLVINPAGANGLEGCSSAQIGVDPGTGKANGNAPTCPDASKLGTAEVDTTLLDHPMPGSVYLATPNDNPFHSLLAIYIVVDDKRSGALIKLSGHVEPNPDTGRLTIIFDNNPQLPFTDFKLHFFGGAAAALRTPAVCGAYSTTSSITPWSGGVPSTPSDNYEISNAPSGGTCAKSVSALPNAPSFDAGTISPIAGASSPLVVNLRRADGTQQFSSVTVTPPPGLLGVLAGIPYCPDSALQTAANKSGTQEKASPSCPAASEVGSVFVGAGAGPAPYNIQGHAYLIGPYKGAPIGLAVVVPAVAGAYDLGTVVVKTALKINPANAQITAVSDTIPSILQGIPLDIRSVQVKLDRPNFTLNPSSCNTMSFTGQLLTTLGQASSLQSRFQLGECVNLGFKPSLSLRLKGKTKRTNNPALVANLKARPGDSNIARAQVTLPAAAFLDNSHIGTVCTRVQFDADQCPPDSVYGTAEATSPLVDYPVSGSVYLRANPEHELPDLVAALNGPASQPIEVDLAGKTDAVKGALRNTFEAVPDVPVSTFRLELFGGSRGLIELSRNFCAKKYRATVQMDAQNGLIQDTTPVVSASCKHNRRPHRHGSRAR